jgi:FkbM family methyltransferase
VSRQRIEELSRAGVNWYPASNNRIVATMLGDVKIVLDRSDYSLTPHLVMSGYWESWITAWFIHNLVTTDKLLNIGANCGYYALAAAHAECEVVAVEPQKHLVENLRISASLNGYSKLKVRECVAGAEQGEVKLQLYPDYHGSAHVTRGLAPLEHPDLAGDIVVVPEFPAHELMPDATCVFVDAEGHEPHIWEGLKPLLDKRQLRWVALEWAPTRYDNPGAFLGALRSCGELAVVNEHGAEERVPDRELLDGGEWDTLVVRPR